MDTQITPKKDESKIEISISLSAEEFKPFLSQAAKTLSKDKPIKGFRPGKVSLDVAVETFGKDRVLTEAVNKAISKLFVQTIMDEDISAINTPATVIEEADIDKGLKFKATVDVLPEVTIGDPSKINIKKKEIEVDEKEIEKELKFLAKSRSSLLDIARPAEDGDTVTVDFKVSIDGKVIEGGESKNHPIKVVEGRFLPDFEKNLKGISAGDERTFKMSFPEDYQQKSLSGKETDVWIKAHAVQKEVLPKIDNDFAKSLGKFKDLDDLKEKLKENTQSEKENKEKERMQGELLEKLVEISTFGFIPEILISKEIDYRLQEFQQMLATQQKTIDDYLKEQNKKMEDVRKEMEDSAKKSVKAGLALEAFVKKEKIEVPEEEVDKKVQEYLTRFASTKQAEQEIDKDELKRNIASTLRNQKALAKLEELAIIKK